MLVSNEYQHLEGEGLVGAAAAVLKSELTAADFLEVGKVPDSNSVLIVPEQQAHN